MIFRYCNFKHNITGGGASRIIKKEMPDLFNDKIICAGSEVNSNLKTLALSIWLGEPLYFSKFQTNPLYGLLNPLYGLLK